MKKITSILMLFLMCFGMAVQAGPTDLPELTKDETNPIWYTIKNVRRSTFAAYAGDAASLAQIASVNPAALFYFTGAIEGNVAKVKIHNALAEAKLLKEVDAWDNTGIDWCVTASLTNNKQETITLSTGLAICKDINDDLQTGWNDFQGGGKIIKYYNPSDAGSIWIVEKVTDVNAVFKIKEAKKNAVDKLQSYKPLNAVFGNSLDQAITKINAVNEAGTFKELVQSWKTIQAISEDMWKGLDGKNVRLTSFGRDAKDGHDIVFRGVELRGVKHAGDAGIWTLQANTNGFVLYNFISNKYIKNVGNVSETILGSDKKNEAGIYQFVAKGENIANLKNNGESVHLAGGLNCVRWSYSDNEGPSQYKITAVDPITITRDLYEAANNAKVTLPFEMQKAAGLAKQGSNYVSNYKATNEGSYEALVDGVYETYFHSSYAASDVAESIPAHDMTVSLSAPTSSIRFYMKKRSQNNNNKPVQVEISASENGSSFKVVKTVTTTMATTADFMSEAIDLGIAATKVRFTVKTTNTGTKFFTLSELYVFPNNSSVAKLADAFINLGKLSIVDPEYANVANTLRSATDELALATAQQMATDELAKAVAVENPTQLGQCSLSALAEAKAAVKTAKNKAEVDNAMKKFRASVVAPVYMIVSAAPKMYCTGKAAYWNGDNWHFAKTDRFNSAFWFKAEGSVENTIKDGGVYKFVNWNSGTTILYDGTATAQAIESIPGAFNLKVNTGHGYLHAQENNSQIVTWLPCDGKDRFPSAWKVEYIGTSYELMNSIPDINAANKVLNDVIYINSIPAGAVGYYSYMLNEANVVRLNDAFNALNNDKDNVSARTNLAEIVSEVRKSETVKFDPTKYYRIKNAMRGGMFSVNVNAALTNVDYNLADVNQIWKFLPVTGGYEIQMVNIGNVLCHKEPNTEYISTFQLKDFGDGQHAMVWNNTNKCYVQYGGGGIGFWNSAEKGNDHMWYLIPATELEVDMNKVAEESWSSLYLPFDVTIPAELEAYTGKLNGQSLKMTKVTEVPANNGVILKGTQNKYTLNIASAKALEGENSLKGTNVKMDNIDKTKFYVLGNGTAGVGLYHPNSTTLKANKAYIELPAGAQVLKFDFDGETTGVEGVEVETENAKAVYYDLSGRRVENPAKGVYIKNGKKVYVK